MYMWWPWTPSSSCKDFCLPLVTGYDKQVIYERITLLLWTTMTEDSVVTNPWLLLRAYFCESHCFLLVKLGAMSHVKARSQVHDVTHASNLSIVLMVTQMQTQRMDLHHHRHHVKRSMDETQTLRVNGPSSIHFPTGLEKCAHSPFMRNLFTICSSRLLLWSIRTFLFPYGRKRAVSLWDLKAGKSFQSQEWSHEDFFCT